MGGRVRMILFFWKEMYSALKAEVPINKQTDYNQSFLDNLVTCDRLYIVGQAMSHSFWFVMGKISRFFLFFIRTYYRSHYYPAIIPFNRSRSNEIVSLVSRVLVVYTYDTSSIRTGEATYQVWISYALQ